jgi:sortase A
MLGERPRPEQVDHATYRRRVARIRGAYAATVSLRLGVVVAMLLVVAGCAGERGTTRSEPGREATGGASPGRTTEPRERSSPSATPRDPGRTPRERTPEQVGPEPSDGRPAAATLTVPDLDLRGFPVVPYEGVTDDAPGTDIQNDGDLASPHGARGGSGPGGVGNYQVTGHRLSSTMPFRYLPSLTRGDEVFVEARGTRYVYRIVGTRETSFRSPESLREQRAAVPGRPGVEPTRAMITLSTCATLEDHAEGNYWSDEFDNPEHRIDKIGVLDRVVAV